MFKGIIRPLQKEDVESVEKIFDLYWNDDFRNHLSDKLNKYITNDSELNNQKFKFFVAEENGEVVGVAGMREIPKHMKEYANTNNAVEFYILAVKKQGEGIGSALTLNRIENARKMGYTEILLFSGITHQDSWKFHDKYFDRIEQVEAPNGESGYIWRKLI